MSGIGSRDWIPGLDPASTEACKVKQQLPGGCWVLKLMWLQARGARSHSPHLYRRRRGPSGERADEAGPFEHGGELEPRVVVREARQVAEGLAHAADLLLGMGRRRDGRDLTWRRRGSNMEMEGI
mgnify:CR=1 FL=1|jgi:hypothetical protein